MHAVEHYSHVKSKRSYTYYDMEEPKTEIAPLAVSRKKTEDSSNGVTKYSLMVQVH